ncbi:MAG: hypothetical protein K2Y28_01160 [Burkholderiaceae bacterium]|nr:hypothetical protein [Burkholderiaceae bacterium]
MNNDISNADLLKKLETINVPDERCSVYSRHDELGTRNDTLEDHHADIARFLLSPDVPKDVVIQYETAKNIYLYAWYVYRFYSVAEHQALACLEMGLRKRFPGALPPGYGNKNKPNVRPTLAPLMRYAIDQGLIRNEGFSRWHQLVRQRTRNRLMYEQIEDMTMTNSMVREINVDDVVANAQDLDCDFVSALDEILPGIRNSYAHGSTRLTSQVLGTFELVNEILAQVYPSDSVKT